MKKKIVGIFIVILLIVTAISQVSAYNGFTTSSDNGSLSGFIKGSFDKPIEGAVVQIICGNFLFMNTSNSSGYYYIGNIPIVDCYWNVSVSKTGYRNISVDMSIDENTTYDFIIKPLVKIQFVGRNGVYNYLDNYPNIKNEFIKSNDDCDCNIKDDSFICYVLRLIYWAILYPFAFIDTILGIISPKMKEIFGDVLYNLFVTIITPLGKLYQLLDCPPMGFPL